MIGDDTTRNQSNWGRVAQ